MIPKLFQIIVKKMATADGSAGRKSRNKHGDQEIMFFAEMMTFLEEILLNSVFHSVSTSEIFSAHDYSPETML